MTVKFIPLKKRQDFIRAARDRASRKWVTPRVIVQSMPDVAPEIAPEMAQRLAQRLAPDVTGEIQPPQQIPQIRIGFTATKRLGSAVVRNRTRRRLRAAVAEILPAHAKPGFAYVFIGRDQTATCPYQCLLDDLKTALIKLHQQKSGPRRAARRRSSGAPNPKDRPPAKGGPQHGA